MRSPHGIGTGHLRAMSVRWQNAGADAKSLICRVSSAVEQRFCKPQVVGSIPTPGTNLINHLADILWMIVVRSSWLGNILGNILPWCIAGPTGPQDGHEAFSCVAGGRYVIVAKTSSRAPN
jgi:hypothetical protein